eukprot:TRINITY_DN4414_c0_g3_i1.p1 TRINITY_DN4414_c0_g3~~TRINITY_DN4414_c0_g3_i1.p1  ORF type:complete len:119 (+),score=13.04 TRINITY_DN4414_c0_g3_i1:268-624(+)
MYSQCCFSTAGGREGTLLDLGGFGFMHRKTLLHSFAAQCSLLFRAARSNFADLDRLISLKGSRSQLRGGCLRKWQRSTLSQGGEADGVHRLMPVLGYLVEVLPQLQVVHIGFEVHGCG